MQNNPRPIAPRPITMAAAALTLICAWIFHPTAEAGAPNKAASTRQIMLAMTVPTSNAVFAAGGDAPSDDKAWEQVEANAAILAESAQLLKTGARVVDRKNWIQYSDALITAAQSAARAAHDKKADKLSDASDAIYQTCENCHKQYLIPQSGASRPVKL